jgi:Domain of unknown function (DUF397)
MKGLNIMSTENTGKIVLSDTEREGLSWVKSQYSGANGQCIEIASTSGKIAIRDSKDPEGPVLVYTTGEFTAFLHGARNGEFDRFADCSG